NGERRVYRRARRFPQRVSESLLFQQATEVAAAPAAVLCPVRIPIGTVGTAGAGGLAALHGLLAKSHGDVLVGSEGTCPLEMGSGQDQEASQLVVVEFPDRVEEITIEPHGPA